MKFLFLVFVVTSFTAYAQISITSSDISAQFTPGNSNIIHTDTIVTSVNIGQLGSTSWDFSFLTPNPSLDIMVTNVDPATTPYHNLYPGSNIASLSQTNFMGINASTYSYFSVNGSFNSHGLFVDADTILVRNTSAPAELEATFPFTFNSIVIYNGERTSVVGIGSFPPLTTITTVVCTTVVDAYGPLTLPGGRIVDVLRLKEDEINIRQGPFPIYSRHISYTFIAKDGSQVNVPSDTTNSTTGVISNTASLSWNDALVTDVKSDKSLPNNYSLKQNYPNPFNPSTSIEYSIPEKSFVELKVYDVLGNEVATLVSEERSAGVYRADFSGSDLASGLYIAQLTAGDYVQTIKMSLLK